MAVYGGAIVGSGGSIITLENSILKENYGS